MSKTALVHPHTSIFLYKFYVRLLEYLILLKSRHDELIQELITLHNHVLILS